MKTIIICLAISIGIQLPAQETLRILTEKRAHWIKPPAEVLNNISKKTHNRSFTKSLEIKLDSITFSDGPGKTLFSYEDGNRLFQEKNYYQEGGSAANPLGIPTTIYKSKVADSLSIWYAYEDYYYNPQSPSGYRDSNFYDNNLLIATITRDHTTNQLSKRNLLFYNSENLVDSTLQQNYNFQRQQWDTNGIARSFSYTLGSGGKITERRTTHWYLAGGYSYNTREEFGYNPNGYLVSHSEFTIFQDGSERLHSLREYVYEGDLLEREIFTDTNFDGETYKQEITSYSYDNGVITRVEFARRENLSAPIINQYRADINLDLNHTKDQILSKFSAAGHPSEDPLLFTHAVEHLHHYNWDGDLNEWIYDFTEDFHYSEITGSSVAENNSSGYTIYPNPSDGIIHITSNSQEIETANLTNLQGQVIKTPAIRANGILDLSYLPAGSYFLQFKNTGSSHKVIIK